MTFSESDIGGLWRSSCGIPGLRKLARKNVVFVPRFSSQVELTLPLLLRMADMHESTKLVGVAGDSFCSS